MVLENNYGKEDVLLDSTAGCVLSGRLPVAFRGDRYADTHAYRDCHECQGQRVAVWMDYAVAPDSGFYGTVLRNGTPVVDAPRGGVLNARILWSFLPHTVRLRMRLI